LSPEFLDTIHPRTTGQQVNEDPLDEPPLSEEQLDFSEPQTCSNADMTPSDGIVKREFFSGTDVKLESNSEMPDWIKSEPVEDAGEMSETPENFHPAIDSDGCPNVKYT